MIRQRVSALLVICTFAAMGGRAGGLTYFYPFDRHFDWDDVAGPAGLGGRAFWEVVPTGGNPDGALHIYTNYWHKDFRVIQINVEPGTTVRIQFDLRVPLQDPDPATWFQVRYFDGYVSALSFATPDDLDDPYPSPMFTHGGGTYDAWQHVDHTTPPLERSVFTLCFQVEGFQSFDNEYYVDNLQIDFTPQSVLRDPGLGWGGIGGGKFIEWRQNSSGRHVAWCDFLEERTHWFDGYCQLYSTDLNYDSWYDTTQTVFDAHAKADYKHNLFDAGAAGVLRVDAAHDSDNAKIYGIRQTVSYDAILPGGVIGDCTAQAQMAIYDGLNQATARFWLGIDPYGGRDVKEERYPNCTGCCDGAPLKWDPSFGVGSFHNMYTSGGWGLRTVNWQRPADAEAFTILLKCMDLRGSTRASEGADFLANAVAVSAVPTTDPHIVLNPISIQVPACYGTPPADGAFTVRNGGTGTIEYEITANVDWLSVLPSDGASAGEADSIAVEYNTAGLPPGMYAGTITVTAPSAVNSPRMLPVKLTVQTSAADFDADGDVDQKDFGVFQACYLSDPVANPRCAKQNLDGDGDIDIDDYWLFYYCANGPEVPIPAGCCPP